MISLGLMIMWLISMMYLLILFSAVYFLLYAIFCPLSCATITSYGHMGRLSTSYYFFPSQFVLYFLAGVEIVAMC